MSMDPVKLLVLPYLQHWEATNNTISLRVLIIPRDSFIVPFVASNPTSPAFFPKVQFKFNVRILSGLQGLLPGPQSGSVVQSVTLPAVPSYASVFEALQSSFGLIINTQTPSRARDPGDVQRKSVRKHLPVSYRDATGYSPSSNDLFTTDNTYSCAMKKVRQKPFRSINKPPKPYAPSWGELIASILRIPEFASAAGFIRAIDVPLDAGTLEEGGYLWLELDPQTAATIGASDAASIKNYAARIPHLADSRDLFTAILFPVIGVPPSVSPSEIDEVFREVEDYSDGWAKAVHCVQPEHLAIVTEGPDNSRPVNELGVRLGWDDEQVTIWADRQIDPLKKGFDDFPLGVHGYRVDVQDVSSGTWFSLAKAQGNFGVQNIVVGQITGELGVGVHPSMPIDVEDDRSYWLPMYFTNWIQSSLVGKDENALLMRGPPPPSPIPPTLTDGNQQRGVIDPALKLLYGKSYKFRVRLMDHTGGGPTIRSTPSNLGPNPSPSITFRRWIRPLVPVFVGDMPSLKDEPGAENSPPVPFIQIKRPQMGYPGVMFAGYPDALNKLKSMAQDIITNPPADKTIKVTEPTLPDPDVDRIEITVLIQTLSQDPLAEDGIYMKLYTTTRRLPVVPSDLTGSVKVNLTWQDCPDVWNPPNSWKSSATDGPLLLPRARTIRLRINALCREEPNADNPYFGADDVRRGPQLMIPLRQNATTEKPLFVNNATSFTINGFFMQPGIDVTSRLAAAIGLRSKDTTLRAQPGKRVVFACGSSLLHLIGPDRASLSFTSHPSLALHWIVVIRLTMQRDWSWDGLPLDGLHVLRDDKDLLFFAPNHNVNEDALARPTPERSSSDIVIVDMVDPNPPPGQNPEQLSLTYEIRTKLLGSVPVTLNEPLRLELSLPVTTRPTQVPQLASAGVAMSPYVHDSGYSTTQPRNKMLWLEFASALDDQEDRYFCRLLKYAPDPLLLGDQYRFPDTEESDIQLDPEHVRRIVPNQGVDVSGLDAMQPLIPTSSPKHWGVPLPPGLTDTSPELFGFYTYEIRVGHYNDKNHTRWSTAQGRFGPPLRVSGVQHPPPLLACSLNRDSSGISVSAPFAKPVQDGNILYIKLPNTEVWFMLYAQAAQIDGGVEKRNILVDRTRGTTGEGGQFECRSRFERDSVNSMLDMYGLKRSTPLSVLAVELFKQNDGVSDPLGGDLGRQRILRTSCLVAVPGMC